MRFALLGEHPDGLAIARALAASGRHAVTVYCGPTAGLAILARDGLQPNRVADLEEALAHPDIEAVVVAGGSAHRAAQLRRALQSERHVLCVHPVDPSPDVGYESAMIQSDVRRVLLPLLPASFHPGIRRLAELASKQRGAPISEALVSSSQLPQGMARMLAWECWSGDECLLDVAKEGHKAGVGGWDVLRRIGGEIAEISALSLPEELEPGEPLLLSGRFVLGGMWQTTLLPRQDRPFWKLSLIDRQGRTELVFPQGWPGPAQLTYSDEHEQRCIEEWPALHPWTAVVEAFESAVADWRSHRQLPQPGVTESQCLTREPVQLGWLDAIRALELDDAVRRSVERRRAYNLDFQEATEEASFKGAMTLVGCSLLWLSLLLLIMSVWLPWLGWFILPVFGIFLIMQVLRWIVPEQAERAVSVKPSPEKEAGKN